MEKHERSLVPEWLRSKGNGSSGVGSKNHNMSSSACSDSSLSYNSKSMTSTTNSDIDTAPSPILDQSSSTNARRGFSNWFKRNVYSNFNVQRSSYRDKNRSREKDRLSYMDPWDHDTSLPIGTFINGRAQEQLRRSHSLTSRKQVDHLAQGFTMGGLNYVKSINSAYNRNGILPGPSLAKSINRNGGPDVVRISSPGLSHVVQSLYVGNPGLTAGEGSTSALTEVPNVIEKSGSVSHGNVGTSFTLKGQTCRNMTEALVQAPRIGTQPQSSSKLQRFEDRTFKKLRLLIPVVPSSPKGSVLIKPMVRSGEIGLGSVRNTQQQSAMLLRNIHSNPGSQIKPEDTKKLVILKHARENGVSIVKEYGTPSRITNNLAAASQMTDASSTQLTTAVGSTNNPRGLRGTSVNILAEKKRYAAQTQSGSAFYNALNKKTSTNISTDLSKTSSSIFSSAKDNANFSKELLASESSSVHAAERYQIDMESVEKVSEVAERNSGFESLDCPDEKEAEFLKSLGWKENNTEEDKALTEEEIRGFIEKCKKLKPSLVEKHII